MKRKTSTRVILITNEQYAELERIQQLDAQNTTTGAAPTINAIARALLDKSLSSTSQGKAA
ncbi:hypothetical protein PP836_002672 [Salmonella enterica]|nr:hypothetical protein [Salmonella enterica subsp. diarizonae]EGV3635462.1 hypothetical protein [Salmonella enterica]EKL0442670.1 hypothetical protein [Salmonella enterica]HCM1889066.1 hypothetical protein [Salmonella enterica subsp. diarizonae serovar 57:c:z]